MPTGADGNLVNLLLIPGGIGTVLLATLAGWRKGPASKPVEATVVSGALADAAAIRDLTEELARHRRALCDTADRAHRDAEQARDATDELAREIRTDREERRKQTLEPPDWALALLAKLDGSAR
jgi:hypothetical protein